MLLGLHLWRIEVLWGGKVTLSSTEGESAELAHASLTRERNKVVLSQAASLPGHSVCIPC